MGPFNKFGINLTIVIERRVICVIVGDVVSYNCFTLVFAGEIWQLGMVSQEISVTVGLGPLAQTGNGEVLNEILIF